jgi:hypothetical protein
LGFTTRFPQIIIATKVAAISAGTTVNEGNSGTLSARYKLGASLILNNSFKRIEQAKMIERFEVAHAICLRVSSNELPCHSK